MKLSILYTLAAIANTEEKKGKYIKFSPSDEHKTGPPLSEKSFHHTIIDQLILQHEKLSFAPIEKATLVITSIHCTKTIFIGSQPF